MSDSPYVINVTAENFESVVIEGSRQQPVLVDFWAAWCQPCQMLMPILAKLADEMGGAFILAKCDTEAEQALAAQFGIRSLPTVQLFKDGQAIDEFAGALPEGQIRAFLDKHLPRRSDDQVAQAMALLDAGQDEAALAMLRDAHGSDPNNLRATLALAEALGGTGDVPGAIAMLDQVPVANANKPEVTSLRARLELAALTDDGASEADLRARLEQDANDSEARFQLGALHLTNSQYEAALEELLTLMRTDRKYGDDAARKTMLQIFEMLGDHPLVHQYRAAMSRLLF